MVANSPAQVRPSSPPTRTRTRLGTAPSDLEAKVAEARAGSPVGNAELAAGQVSPGSRAIGRLDPRLLRQTQQARKQLGAMLAMWAMFARGRRLNREAREAEETLEGKMRAATKRATANIRPSTGHTFGATAGAVREQVCNAFGREDGGAGLPWPHRPHMPEDEGIEVHSGDDDDELGGGGVCRMAMLVPHGDLSGMSGLTAGHCYRQLWEAGDNNGFPDVVVIVGTSEPWGNVPADWEEAGFTSGISEQPVDHAETNAAVQMFSEKVSPSNKVLGSIHSETGKQLLCSTMDKSLELNAEPEPAPAEDSASWTAAQRAKVIDAHIDASMEMEVALCTDRWETPLGIVEPHNIMIEKLSARGYRVHSGMHRYQESIEAQLPFLQALKPDVRIVPILVGKLNRKMASRLATDISSIIAGSGHSVGLIGCTNLGHSGPMYGRTPKSTGGTSSSHAQSDSDLANSLCMGASSASVQAFNKRAQRANVCGRWTAIVLMLAARSLNLRQGRVLARTMTVDRNQNTVGHAAIIFGPTADEEERTPVPQGEAPSLIKRASDGTILAGSAPVFKPAERIPKVVPNPEDLRADHAGRKCHSIGDALCYWHNQTSSKCIGVVITLPCFPRDEGNEQDAAIDAYGAGRNREPKMTPRTASELSILGASNLPLVGDDSDIQHTTAVGANEYQRRPHVPEHDSSSSHQPSRSELRDRVFGFDSTGDDARPSSPSKPSGTDGLGFSMQASLSNGSSLADRSADGLTEVVALKRGATSSSSLNSSSSVSASFRTRNAGRLVSQRKRMAMGPGGVYTHLLPEAQRQGWAVLQLIWPTWAEGLDDEQLLRFAVLAARDAARWVLNVQDLTPLVLIGWGSSAVAAIEAGARLAWDHGRDTVNAVATLSVPGPGLDLVGVKTLPLCENALQQSTQCYLVKMSGAEEYCPEDTHAMGGVLQRQAHVTSLVSMLGNCSKKRENGSEKVLLERSRPESMHRSPAWHRLQSRYGMKAQHGVHIGEYGGRKEDVNSQVASKEWQPSTTRARSLIKTSTGESRNLRGHF
eukprot:COSAG02_NODE_3921_length_6045_cov_2.284729_3_plen_1043_part_00